MPPAVVRTVSVPTADLLRDLEPIPAGLTVGVWNFDDNPQGVDLDQLDLVVLPYADRTDWRSGLGKARNLKLVQTQTTGYDGVREAAGPGVAVATAAGAHTVPTAELALGLMLAHLRGIDAAARGTHGDGRNRRPYPGLADRRVLLVGVGDIGRQIARLLEPFGVELTRVGRTARDDEQGHIHASSELPALAAGADVLVLITPLTAETRHLVDATVLAALPDGALVVNVARGAVVDSEALTAEVVSGRLHAALDVFDPEPVPEGHPLHEAPNALLTPHVGGNSQATRPRVVRFLRSQLEALAAGERPANLVQEGPFAVDEATVAGTPAAAHSSSALPSPDAAARNERTQS